jgi:hypothetical protein
MTLTVKSSKITTDATGAASAGPPPAGCSDQPPTRFAAGPPAMGSAC